ncbi:hypothetical protein BC828DRAFT_392124 [Blastocladiella britannica]|nr:hypothetical protein BC828DRAFT_392124 [Blastocladiella britannica]
MDPHAILAILVPLPGQSGAAASALESLLLTPPALDYRQRAAGIDVLASLISTKDPDQHPPPVLVALTSAIVLAMSDPHFGIQQKSVALAHTLATNPQLGVDALAESVVPTLVPGLLMLLTTGRAILRATVTRTFAALVSRTGSSSVLEPVLRSGLTADDGRDRLEAIGVVGLVILQSRRTSAMNHSPPLPNAVTVPTPLDVSGIAADLAAHLLDPSPRACLTAFETLVVLAADGSAPTLDKVIRVVGACGADPRACAQLRERVVHGAVASLGDDGIVVPVSEDVTGGRAVLGRAPSAVTTSASPPTRRGIDSASPSCVSPTSAGVSIPSRHRAFLLSLAGAGGTGGDAGSVSTSAERGGGGGGARSPPPSSTSPTSAASAARMRLLLRGGSLGGGASDSAIGLGDDFVPGSTSPPPPMAHRVSAVALGIGSAPTTPRARHGRTESDAQLEQLMATPTTATPPTSTRGRRARGVLAKSPGPGSGDDSEQFGPTAPTATTAAGDIYTPSSSASPTRVARARVVHSPVGGSSSSSGGAGDQDPGTSAHSHHHHQQEETVSPTRAARPTQLRRKTAAPPPTADRSKSTPTPTKAASSGPSLVTASEAADLLAGLGPESDWNAHLASLTALATRQPVRNGPGAFPAGMITDLVHLAAEHTTTPRTVVSRAAMAALGNMARYYPGAIDVADVILGAILRKAVEQKDFVVASGDAALREAVLGIPQWTQRVAAAVLGSCTARSTAVRARAVTAITLYFPAGPGLPTPPSEVTKMLVTMLRDAAPDARAAARALIGAHAQSSKLWTREVHRVVGESAWPDVQRAIEECVSQQAQAPVDTVVSTMSPSSGLESHLPMPSTTGAASPPRRPLGKPSGIRGPKASATASASGAKSPVSSGPSSSPTAVSPSQARDAEAVPPTNSEPVNMDDLLTQMTGQDWQSRLQAIASLAAALPRQPHLLATPPALLPRTLDALADRTRDANPRVATAALSCVSNSLVPSLGARKLEQYAGPMVSAAVFVAATATAASVRGAAEAVVVALTSANDSGTGADPAAAAAMLGTAAASTRDSRVRGVALVHALPLVPRVPARALLKSIVVPVALPALADGDRRPAARVARDAAAMLITKMHSVHGERAVADALVVVPGVASVADVVHTLKCVWEAHPSSKSSSHIPPPPPPAARRVAAAATSSGPGK